MSREAEGHLKRRVGNGESGLNEKPEEGVSLCMDGLCGVIRVVPEDDGDGDGAGRHVQLLGTTVDHLYTPQRTKGDCIRPMTHRQHRSGRDSPFPGLLEGFFFWGALGLHRARAVTSSFVSPVPMLLKLCGCDCVRCYLVDGLEGEVEGHELHDGLEALVRRA